MNIKNIFDMARADKYTKDGREEIIKAQETEDARRYKTGEISEATGLQKQPDGSWAPPKGGAGTGAKQPNPNGITARLQQQREAEKYEAARRDSNMRNEEPKQKEAKQKEKYKTDTDEYTGVFNINLKDDIFLYFAPKSEEDLSGWSIYNDGEYLTGSGDWENATPEKIKNDLKEMEKKLEKIVGPDDAKEITEKVRAAVMQEAKSESSVEPKKNYMGMSKAAALNFAKESGSTAFLMKNAKGEYAVANSADEFNEAEANGYEGAMEELRPDTPREQRKLPNRGGDYLAERLNSFYRDEEDIKSNLEGTGFELLDFTNEYATVQNQAGSQFELKFSAHGDGHDFGVESVKRIYDDPDDDTTDAAPLTGDTKIRVKK